MTADHVANALLLATTHHHRTHVYLDSHVPGRGQGAGTCLAPGIAPVRSICFLRQRQGRKQSQRKEAGEL